MFYFDPIYCFVDKRIFILKRPSDIDYTQGLFSLGFCLRLCSSKQKEGEAEEGCLAVPLPGREPLSLSLPGVAGDPDEIPDAPCARGGQQNYSRFTISAVNSSAQKQHRSGAAFVVVQ